MSGWSPTTAIRSAITPMTPTATIAGREPAARRAVQQRQRDQPEQQHRARVLVEPGALAVGQDHRDRPHVRDGQEFGHDQERGADQADHREHPPDAPSDCPQCRLRRGKTPRRGPKSLCYIGSPCRGAARSFCAPPQSTTCNPWRRRPTRRPRPADRFVVHGPAGPFSLLQNHAAEHALTHAQHRDHGPHRCGQDDDDRAHPLLHRKNPQDGGGSRGRGRHGLDGPGAGARHHHHFRRDHVLLARQPHQHHRHARPRRLHRRGRALAARARRRHRAVRLGRRRRAPVRDRLAPGRQVPRPAHRLHQQDGPHRGRLRSRRPDHDRPPRRPPGADPASDRRGGRLPRDHRPRRQQGDHLQGRARDRVRGHRHPGRVRRRGRAPPASTCSRRSPTTTTSCSR